VNGQLHALIALSLVKEMQYLLDRRVGGPQNQSGHGGEEEMSGKIFY